MIGKRFLSVRRVAVGSVVGLGVTAAGIAVGGATPGSGSSSTLIGRAPVSEEVDINTGAIKLKTKEPFDVITQTVTIQPGGTSGWHGHPGPVFVVVKTGAVTVYDQSCTTRRYSAGQGFVEGPDPAVVRNEGSEVSESVATLLVPQGQPARIDAASQCPGIL
ncbi:MAG TPA: hypothetical protein VNT56_01350 [Acidimicrobiales bacterium]|jgi:quercetin dioxygenase-like cupin family protein|nr:hypothetical protein [Acidimicrobiales bacterium]